MYVNLYINVLYYTSRLYDNNKFILPDRTGDNIEGREIHIIKSISIIIITMGIVVVAIYRRVDTLLSVDMSTMCQGDIRVYNEILDMNNTNVNVYNLHVELDVHLVKTRVCNNILTLPVKYTFIYIYIYIYLCCIIVYVECI